MSKKQDAFYFENFITCAGFACQEAHLLEEVIQHFEPSTLKQKLDQMHELEHAADEKKHELHNVLAKAFITPIEREDMVLLSQSIDELTDEIEDVLLRIYCNNVKSIRPDALDLANVLIRCCEEVRMLMNEFSDFHHSKKLREHIIHINTMEEQADKLFIAAMRKLHTTCTDPIVIITWREIYIYLEKCADACEHVADAVESIVMKNT